MVVIHCRYTSHHFAIRKVIHGIVKGLYGLDSRPTVALLVNKNNLADFEQYKDRFTILTIPVHADSALWNHLFNIFILPLIILFKRVKTIVFPQISFFLLTGAKTIVFIHDLIEYKLRNQQLTKHIVRHLFFPWVARRSDVIVTVSQNSRQDIAGILGVPGEKMLIAYDGIDHILPFIKQDRSFSVDYVKSRFGLDAYALYVGYLALPQKNLLFLLRSFKKYIEQRNDESTKMVFVGPKGKDHELIFAEAAALQLGDRFVYLGTLSEEDLCRLYQAASVFCFPSLYEGFGMPVAEAMACGCPVITSNCSSLPEVAGEAGMLIDPEDID